MGYRIVRNNRKGIITPQQARAMRLHRVKPGVAYSPPMPEQPDLLPTPSILITGGIGDVFTIESFMGEDHRACLETIYYATPQHDPIVKAFKMLPNFPKLKNHVILWNDFSVFSCFCTKWEVLKMIENEHKPMPADAKEIADWSISQVFPLIEKQKLRYRSSSFLRFPMADISQFNLKNPYVLIFPHSLNELPEGIRSFDDSDWTKTIKFLEQKDQQGVIVGIGTQKVPEHPRLVSLINKTTMPETIEILKYSAGYIGIDSCISVLASKLFSPPDLMIKCNNPHGIRHAKIYFAPHSSFHFIQKMIL